MRIMSMFHTLVVLMIVLTFSTSFITLAQQHPVPPEVSKTDVAQNANAVVEAKAAAEQDASKDTNEPFWFCVGASCSPFILLYGYMGSQMILNSSDYSGGIVGPSTPGGAYIMGFCLLASSVSCIGIVNHGISSETPGPGGLRFIMRGMAPPPERLIGKSPEYVQSYLDAYKRKVRMLRGKSTTLGGAVVCGCLFGLGVLVASQEQ